MDISLKCSHILVRGVNWVGDAVMTMPAVRCMRDNFRDSRISLLVKPWVIELFRHDPNLNELIGYTKEFQGFLGKFRAAREIRKRNFGCSFLFQNAFDAAVLALLAGIPKRIGYNRDGRGFLLSDAIRIDDKTLSLHHIHYYLNLLQRAGLRTEYRLPWIYPDIKERIRARNTLSHLLRPVIGLNPGATYGSAKRWPPKHFGEVAESVIRDMGGSIVIFGSEKEYPMSLEIIDAMDRDLTSEKTVLNLSGKTRLHELCDLIAECDVLVSNDSGPMHIGYAVGTPLVALFGSTSPALTGPPDCFFDGAEFGYAFRVLKEDIECSPCFERTCRFGHLACMDRISPEAVINAVKEIIPGRKAIFFDRDGTLCKNARYLSSMDDLDIFPETGELASLKGKGYLIIGISNQSGVARGIVREDFVREVHRIFIEHYGFDAFYYCPHHPDDRCACRKPMPGMLLKARAELKIDLRKSFFAGDSYADMATAKMAGAQSVLIAADAADTPEFADFRIHNLRQLFSLVGE